MSLLEQLRPPRLRDYWVRWNLRQVHYADRVRKLDRVYCVENPWRMDSAQEQARFAWTNGVISTHLPNPGTVLEIGCGEGHQSLHLSRLCRHLYGIDVSARAVRRARRRCPNASFGTGDAFAFHFADMPPVADLVVACEMVYYVKDIPRLLERMSCLGRSCLATYHEQHGRTLGPYFAGLPHCEQERFRFGHVEWVAVWWRNS